ncbi:MAG: hypothetical protein Q7S56_03325 [Nanoarchaeota archaeon]|nr:hypothetical protein [Nanoarchaeota archaeon]
MAEATTYKDNRNDVSYSSSGLEKEVLVHLRQYLDFMERISYEPSRIKIDLNHISRKIAPKLNNKYSNIFAQGESFSEMIRGIMRRKMKDFNYEENGRPYTFQLTDVGIEKVSERDWINYARKQLKELGYKPNY